MKSINKINLFDGTVEEVTMFNSSLTCKLDAMGVDAKEALIKINAETPKAEEAESVVKAALCNYSNTGYTLNGITYRPFMAGASDARKATATWVNEDIIAELGKWAMCGLQTKDMKLAINKYMAYIGLLSSASKPFVEVFSKPINIRRVAIVKDAFVKVTSKVDFQTMSETSHNIDRTVEINAFDGFGVVRSELTKGESLTIRGPWLKAFVQATNWSRLFGFGIQNEKKSFIDFWGNERLLKDVDMILTESCFKTISQYKDWEQYCNAFEELGHEICVCVREHKPRLKGLPYQQGQTLMGTTDDALHFMAHAKKTVYKYHDASGAPKLLRGNHRIAAGLYPALLTENYTQRAIQEMYTTKRNDMLGGRIPEMGYNAFLAPDPVAFAEHLFGLEIKGYLKAGECYCSNCERGAVDITRNPHFDNAHVVLNNVGSMPLAEGPTMFINIFDMTTIQLRADYDGDHVWYSQDEYLLDLVNRTYEKLQNLPIDWEVGKAEKVAITKSAVCKFITNLIHGSEIGLYADALTKMWNTGYDRDVCDWLTYAGNVLIDAAKHAAVKIQKPDAVKALNNVSLPLFAMYAKADNDEIKMLKSMAKAIDDFNDLKHYEVSENRFAIEHFGDNHNDHSKAKVLVRGITEYKDITLKDYCENFEDEKYKELKTYLRSMDLNHPEIYAYWFSDRVTKSGKVLPPRCAYSGSFLDQYSKLIKENIEETMTIEGLDDEIFDVTTMMFDPKRKIGRFNGLSKKGTFDRTVGTFEDCGLFQEIAFRHSTEWNKIVGDMGSYTRRSEWEAETAKEARKEIIDWAYAQYPEVERSPEMDERMDNACYDIIVRNIHTVRMTEGMDTVIKQAFWRIYGDKAVKALKQNLCKNDVDFDSDEFDDLLDVDEDED